MHKTSVCSKLVTAHPQRYCVRMSQSHVSEFEGEAKSFVSVYMHVSIQICLLGFLGDSEDLGQLSIFQTLKSNVTLLPSERDGA
jgi:hypothetical protein